MEKVDSLITKVGFISRSPNNNGESKSKARFSLTKREIGLFIVKNS